MAKKTGKKLTDEGSFINSPNKKIRKRSTKGKKKKLKMDAASASVDDSSPTKMLVPVLTPAVATTTIVAHNNKAKQVNKEEKENIELTSGFIFMCNGKTKPECYLNRVFGLPKGQVELVKKIKPGEKLFLFDFDLKLLYGVYKATSSGELNLEPTAFDGKFPAQVRFEIFKECLPLTEKAFKHTIKDNYHGSKFRQDLTREQVKALISLFRPITAPTSVTAAPPLSNVVTRHTYPIPIVEERFQLPARLPHAYDSYLPRVCYGNVLWPCVSQSEQASEACEGHGKAPLDHQHTIQQASKTYVGQGQPSLDPLHIVQQALEKYVGHGQPPLNPRHIVQQAVHPHCIESYYSMEAHQPYLPEKSSLSAQDLYQRYKPAQEVVQRDRVTGYISEQHSSGLARNRDVVQHSETTVDYHSQNLPPKVALQMHAQRDLLSAYQPHYPVTSNENIHQVYADSSEVGRKTEAVQHSGNMVDYYSRNLPPDSASHVLLQTHEQRYQPHYPMLTGQHLHQAFPILPPASASHFSLQIHTPTDSLSSYQPHYPLTTSNGLHQIICQSSSKALRQVSQSRPIIP